MVARRDPGGQTSLGRTLTLQPRGASISHRRRCQFVTCAEQQPGRPDREAERATGPARGDSEPGLARLNDNERL